MVCPFSRLETMVTTGRRKKILILKKDLLNMKTRCLLHVSRAHFFWILSLAVGVLLVEPPLTGIAPDKKRRGERHNLLWQCSLPCGQQWSVPLNRRRAELASGGLMAVMHGHWYKYKKQAYFV
jgi:hypothetical protein